MLLSFHLLLGVRCISDADNPLLVALLVATRQKTLILIRFCFSFFFVDDEKTGGKVEKAPYR